MSVLEEITREMNSGSSMTAVHQANRIQNPMGDFTEFFKYSSSSSSADAANGSTNLDFDLYCRRKSEMDPKVIKWAFKLAERNVGPQYRACNMGWQPKVKQTDLNKNWARYLVATERKTKQPVAYAMFRFDMDYSRCVLYCYELQVAEGYRRLGLGAFLMKALEHMARHYAMELVVLTVLKNNPDGLRFYHRLGYEEDETSPEKSEEKDYIIMSKRASC